MLIFKTLKGYDSGGIIISNKDLFKENSNHGRQNLKERIIKQNLIEYKCDICNLGSHWNNQKLTLQLDHKNGIHNDNRLENLRFLCPNCHSQTNTFAGKKLKKRKENF